MNRSFLVRILIIGFAGLAAIVRRPMPGASVPDSVACTLRGGNCQGLAALTCQGSGIHIDGTTCPLGSLIVGGSQMTCAATGNSYCCGITSCWTCYSGWLTCVGK